ncbi:MAG: hypothetical protein HYR89_02695 [Actinobacteria bacterium]|nr:hypothetical protein [Actinomycetota bacterium]
MRFWRRHQRSRTLDTTDSANLPVATDRLERAVMMMAMHAQQLTDRLERVERGLAARDVDIDLVERVDELSVTMATQGDLIEVQVRTARLAGELARVAADLRSEIGRLHDALPVGPVRRTIHLDRVATELEGLSAIVDQALPDTIVDHRGLTPRP